MNKIDTSVAAMDDDGGEPRWIERVERHTGIRHYLYMFWKWLSLGLPDVSATMFRQKMTALEVAPFLEADENGVVDQQRLQSRLDTLKRKLKTRSGRSDWSIANEIEILLVGRMCVQELRVELARQLIDARALKLPSVAKYEELARRHENDIVTLRATVIRLISDIQGRFRKRYLLREYVAAYTARVSLVFVFATTLFMAMIIWLSILAFDFNKQQILEQTKAAAATNERKVENSAASANSRRAGAASVANSTANAPPEASAPTSEAVAKSAAAAPPKTEQQTAADVEKQEAAALLNEVIVSKPFMNSFRAFSSFYLAVVAGLFGAAFSMMAQTRKRVEISSLEDMRTNARFAMLFFRLGVGIGAAMVLYFIFDTNMVGNGALTPQLSEVGFNNIKDESGMELIAIGALSPNKDLSLLMLWSFVAGFSEVLVPSILRRTEGEAVPKEAR